MIREELEPANSYEDQHTHTFLPITPKIMGDLIHGFSLLQEMMYEYSKYPHQSESSLYQRQSVGLITGIELEVEDPYFGHCTHAIVP